MVADSAWSLIGAASWDLRSLRLNFELGGTCFDPSLAASLIDHVTEKIERGRRLRARELEARSLPVGLRDARRACSHRISETRAQRQPATAAAVPGGRHCAAEFRYHGEHHARSTQRPPSLAGYRETLRTLCRDR